MLSVIVALYNEERRFSERYARLRDYLENLREPWELILVDDGSSDRTFERIGELAAADPRVRALGLQRNLGQGAALKVGILSSRGEVVLYTDADMPIPFSCVRQLLEQVRSGSDVALASRWIRGAKINVPQPWMRRVLGKMYYKMIHVFVLDGVHDTNCGLKAYRGDAARMLFGFVRSWRWTFNVEHLWLAKRWGYTVTEIPCEWSHQGSSKVHVLQDGIFTLWELVALKLRQVFGIYPLTRRS